MSNRRVFSVLFAALLWPLSSAPAVSTQPDTDHDQSAFTFTRFVVVSFGEQSIGGGFQGTKVVTSVKGAFSVPKIADGTGFGITLGLRNALVGIEGGYHQSSHTLQWSDIAGEGDLRSAEVNGNVYAPAVGPVSIFLSGGMSMEWLSVDNGYCSDSTGRECTARFEGVGFSVGPGLNLQMPGSFFLTSRLVYRQINFDTIESVEAGEGTLPYAVEGDGWTWSTGIGFGF